MKFELMDEDYRKFYEEGRRSIDEGVKICPYGNIPGGDHSKRLVHWFMGSWDTWKINSFIRELEVLKTRFKVDLKISDGKIVADIKEEGSYG